MSNTENTLPYGQPAADGQPTPHRRRHNLEPFTDSSRTRVLRFWLNIIFLIGAVAGLIIYFYSSHYWGTITLIVASVFKFIELALRILKI